MSEKTVEPRTPHIAVGKLGAARGVDGQLKVISYSGEFGHIEKLGEVWLAPPGESAAGKTYLVVGRSRGAWGLSLAFKGYESPEKAKALVGMELFVAQEGACPLSEGEWYVSDLVGMSLVYGGRTLARVVAVLDGAADPLLESEPEGGGKRTLVPFRKEFIGAINSEEKTIELLNEWILG